MNNPKEPEKFSALEEIQALLGLEYEEAVTLFMLLIDRLVTVLARARKIDQEGFNLQV